MYNITYQLFCKNAKHDSHLTAYGGIVQIYKGKYGKLCLPFMKEIYSHCNYIHCITLHYESEYGAKS